MQPECTLPIKQMLTKNEESQKKKKKKSMAALIKKNLNLQKYKMEVCHFFRLNVCNILSSATILFVEKWDAGCSVLVSIYCPQLQPVSSMRAIRIYRWIQ